METALEHQTLVGVGFANLVDAFQAGREAAQMAKRELPDHAPIHLVLAICPDAHPFKDFVEGVRLVSGEETLLSIPSTKVFFHSPTPPDSCFVIMISSQQNQYHLTSADMAANPLPAMTKVMSDFRQARGNNRYQFAYHGVFYFDNSQKGLGILPTQLLAADAGLDSWIVGATPQATSTQNMMCREHTVTHGLVALECLTHSPLGIGVVNLQSFPQQQHILREALRVSLRDAVLQMEQGEPALGLVLMDFDSSSISSQDFQSVFMSNNLIQKPFPLIGICTQSQTFRPKFHSVMGPSECVFSMVIPK